MRYFVKRLDKAKKAIDEGDFIVIGAGAGLSAAAGIEYSGKRFTDNFKEFIEKYSMADMYSSGFYPFKTSEEKWAYWAKHIYLNRFQVGKTDLYQKLLKLVENKDYFVITTNVEHQFWINGFEDERIFATQGDYGFLQCGEVCHNKLYYNEDLIKEMVEKTVDCKIPSDLIPTCPVCGAEMETNLRKDNLFVQDEKWYEANERYSNFLRKIEDNKVVFLELGVGYNTPSIIKYPFEQWTYDNKNATLIRINRDYPDAIKENESKTISFDEDMDEIFDYWLSRIF
ncbi:NAD-dependent protein deacetylase, SIR2 family [uncultured Methanobrevibacter sp.]|uniref:NAD-dependent protein deacetylase, SIR2 family n=1 Tax=uncultured Methanobrevibacter sp. TaxID=253161 RepID=UPI0025F5238E|nr:NAD-dependent protein deacetylase, SIR2 family [uncultured Methanobrevibacter sp.]